jgi:HEPN domain-containing protein
MSSGKKNIDTNKLKNHWLDSSDKDFQTMLNLYNSKDYNWSLFIGHIVIEKLLKANYVINKKEYAPFTHDLLRLAKLGGLEVEVEKSNWLDTVTTFNINARYESYKQEFYKKCTLEFTEIWIKRIKELRQWIKDKL